MTRDCWLSVGEGRCGDGGGDGGDWGLRGGGHPAADT